MWIWIPIIMPSMYIYIVTDYYLNAFYWICIIPNIEKMIDSRYDYMHIWLLTGFISGFYLFFISRFSFVFFFLHISGQYCLFAGLRTAAMELKNHPGNQGRFSRENLYIQGGYLSYFLDLWEPRLMYRNVKTNCSLPVCEPQVWN